MTQIDIAIQDGKYFVGFYEDTMDTSIEYVKMCEKAEEVQEFGESHQEELGLYDYDKNFFIHRRTETIWLPRQDQLQEMVVGTLKTWALAQLFNDFLYNQSEQTLRWSFEKLWLAFVMEKRFGKTWDGEEWVKIE
jgi:hypothetical protein